MISNSRTVLSSPDGARSAEVTAANRLSTDTVVTNSSQNYLSLNQLYSICAEVNIVDSALDNPLILLRNPTGSGKVIYIYKLAAGVFTTNVAASFKLFTTPTITTNGTAINIASRFINNGAIASVILPTSLPTISANGTCMAGGISGQNNNTVTLVSDFSAAIAPGGSLLVTGKPSSNNRTANIEFTWAEVPV